MAISAIGAEQAVFEPSVGAGAASSAPSKASALTPSEGESPFLKAMRGLGTEIDVGEKQVAGASQYREYDTATLIALQAGIYRYTEAVDLASKIVDRATNAVKTVLQGGGH